jgi:hypothetical protein
MYRYRVSIDGAPAELGTLLTPMAALDDFETGRAVSQRHGGRAIGIECFEEFEDEFHHLVADRHAVTVLARTNVLPNDHLGIHDDEGVPLPKAVLRRAAQRIIDQRLRRRVGTLSSGLDDALTIGAALGRFCTHIAPDAFDDPSPATLEAVVELAVLAWWMSMCGTNGDAGSLEFDHALRMTQAVISAGRSELDDQQGRACWMEWQRLLISSGSDVIAAACDPQLDCGSYDWTPAELVESPIERLESAALSLLTMCLQALALFAPVSEGV